MSELSDLNYNADRLSREAVLKEMARHRPETRLIWGSEVKAFCEICWTDAGQLMWPCPTVENLSAAEEAINEAIAEAERVANGPYYCGVETRAMRYVDPEPAEHCENEVSAEGERCARHDGSEQDRDDYDYERMKDARYDE